MKYMNTIDPKPYKLAGKIQNYKWGTKNENAFIPKLLNFMPEENIPYAEYWIGVHPKAPSEVLIDNKKVLLTDILEKFPNEILGNRIVEKYGKTLPFLLKILSINQALSIQAHPDKKLAEILHEKDPKNYPDNNHKPEIAIAIDQLQAIVGLKDISQLKVDIEKYYEIKKLIDDNLIAELENLSGSSSENWVKEFYKDIMSSTKSSLKDCIINIKSRIEKSENRTKSEEQFLIQFNNYGIDIGLLSILLFNFVNLKSGEAIFTPAGIPHAYIKGNIVECMANSDNVVRAGLTPKYKDLETLTKMLTVNSDETAVKKIEDECFIKYQTRAEEFEISKIKLNSGYSENSNNEIKIIIVLDGEVEIKTSNYIEKYKKGDIILIPALLNQYEIIEILSAQVYQVIIP